jgi:hypothetical protein
MDKVFDIFKNRLKSVLSMVLSAALIFSISTFAAVTLGHAVSDAATTGDCGANGIASSSTADAKTITWAGKKWDLIGVSSGGTTRGIAGPAGTVTLLQNYQSSGLVQTVYNSSDTDQESAKYSTSALKVAMDGFYNGLSTTEKAQVVMRNLVGNYYDSKSADYNTDAIYGPNVDSQAFWPLSQREAMQLKGSVRKFVASDSYWLRSITSKSSGGYVIPMHVQDGISGGQSNIGGFLQGEGEFPSSDTNYARPAVYVNASAIAGLNAASDTIGACPINPTVQIGGYKWDIVGIKDGSSAIEGVNFGQSNNQAALVYSAQNSARQNPIQGKWAASNSSNYDSSTIAAWEDTMANAMNDANIVPRTVSTIPAITNRKLWAMSRAEAETLDYAGRIYTGPYWTRSQSNGTSQVESGIAAYFVSQNGGTSNNQAGTKSTFDELYRPAMLYNLNDELRYYWANRNASWAGLQYGTRVDVTSSCFNYTAPSSLTYDKQTHTASVTTNAASCPSVGSPSVTYEGINGTNYARQSTAPTDSGSYQVAVSGSATTNYNAYTNLQVGSFVIAKQKLTVSPKWGRQSSVWDWQGTGQQKSPSSSENDARREFDGSATANWTDDVFGSISGSNSRVMVNDVDLSNGVTGVLPGDTISQANVGSGVATSLSDNFAPPSTGQCFRHVQPRSADPRYDFTSPDVGAKSVQVLLLNSTNPACASIWANYTWDAPTKLLDGKTFYTFTLPNAGTITKNTSATINISVPDITVAKGAPLPTPATLIQGGQVSVSSSGWLSADAIKRLVGAFTWSADPNCNTGSENVSGIVGCIERGSLDAPDYQNISFTGGKLKVVDKTPQGDLEVQAVGAKTYGDANFTLSLAPAKQGSGSGSVTYTCTDGCTPGASQVATVAANGDVAIIGAGTFKASATKVGDTTYSDKTSSEVSVVINKYTTNVTGMQAQGRVYSGAGDTSVSLVQSGITFSKPAGKASDDLSLQSCSGSVPTGAAGSRLVTLAGCLLGGTAASNYTLGSINTFNLSISQKEVTPSFNVTSKVYDSLASVSSSQVTVTLGTSEGVVAGDTLTQGTDFEFGTGAYSDESAGSGKLVSLIVNAKPTAAMQNYALSNSGIYADVTSADIDKRSLSVTADDVTVAQGNTRPSALTYAYTGHLPSETPTFTGALSWKASGCDDMNTVGDVADCIELGSLALASNPVSSNYQIGTFTKGKLSVVNKTPQGDLEVQAVGAKTYGDANFTLSLAPAKQGSGSGSVTYTCTDGCTQVANVASNGQVSINGAGTFKVTATKAEDATYASKTSAELSIVVAKKSLTAPPNKAVVADKVYDGTLSATLSGATISPADIAGRVSTDDVSITCTTAAFASADVGQNKTVNVSGCALGGSDAGKYALSSATTTTIATITAAPRTLVVNASATSGVYGTLSTVNLSATPSDGAGNVDYTCVSGCGAGDSFPATISGSTVSIKGAGVITVRASIVASGNYQSATSGDETITISAKDVSVSGGIVATPRGYIVGNTQVAVNTASATFSSLVSGDASKVGLSCDANGSMADADAGYSKTVTLSGCTLTGVKASSYNLTGSVTTGVDISPANQAALSIDALSTLTYGDSDYTLASTGGTTGGQVTYECVTAGCQGIISITDNQMSILAAGSTQIKATMPGNTNYNAVQSATVTVTVLKKDITLVAPNANRRAYNGSTNVDLTSGGLISVLASDTAYVALTCPQTGTMANANKGVAKPVTVAACSISGAKVGNYNLASATPQGVTVDIDPAGLSVIANDVTVIQNAGVSIPTPGFTYSGEVGSEVPSFTGALAKAAACNTTNIGTINDCIEQGTLTASGNYEISSFAKGKLIVTDKIPQSITFADVSPNITYQGATTSYAQSAQGGTGQGAVTYAIESSGTTAQASINATTGAVSNITKAGTLHVKATKAGDATYAAASADYVLSIAKGTQSTLTATNPGAQTYGATAITLSSQGGSGAGSVSYQVVSGVATISSDQMTLTGAGQVVFKATKAEDDLYLSQQSANVTFSVGAKAVQVQGLTAQDKEYDTNNSASISGSPTLSGVQGADSANVSVSCPGAGTFASVNAAPSITVTLNGNCTLSGAKAQNYVISSINALSATIRPRDVIVVADNISVRENSALPARSALTYSATGLLGGDTPQGVFEGQLDYTTLSTPGGISCSNLATPQTLSNCIIQGTLTTKVLSPGSNYRIDSFVGGDIIVTQLTPQLPLSINSVSPLVLGHGCVTLQALGGSGQGAVTFSNTGGNALATLNAQTGELCPQSAGTFEVRATKASDGTYAEMSSPVVTVTIRPRIASSAVDALGSVQVEVTFPNSTMLDLGNLSVILTPQEISASNGIFEDFDAELSADVLHRLFEIHLEDGASNTVPIPNGEQVQVTISNVLKDGATPFKLWHKHESDPATRLNSSRVGLQHISFTTDRFSLFGISYEAPTPPSRPEVPGPGAGSGNQIGGQIGGQIGSPEHQSAGGAPSGTKAGLAKTGSDVTRITLVVLLALSTGYILRRRMWMKN